MSLQSNIDMIIGMISVAFVIVISSIISKDDSVKQLRYRIIYTSIVYSIILLIIWNINHVFN